MKRHDYKYFDLVNNILEHGTIKENRTGVNTISLFACNMRFDISDGTIPLLTSKKVHLKSIIHELLWFINGDTNIKYLNDNGVTIWDEWADSNGNLGDVYGAMWRAYPATNEYKLIERRSVDATSIKDDYDILDDFIVTSKTSLEDYELKKVWDYIVKRCESTGALLSDGWSVASTFIHDAKRLPGYVKARNNNEYYIDNNYYGISKVFSNETCVFNTKQEVMNNASGDMQIVIDNGRNKLFFVNTISAAEYLGCDVTEIEHKLNRPNNKISGYTVRILSASTHVARKLVDVDQLLGIIDRIKNKPNDRRLILNAWNPSLVPNDDFSPTENVKLGYQALPPCHAFMQFYVNDNKLSCHLYQRSCDIGLGVPFNIAQYSILTHMIAKVTGLNAGEFVWTGGDVHIYENHVDALRKQLNNDPYNSPTLQLSEKTDILDFNYEDIMVNDYEHHELIKMDVAV